MTAIIISVKTARGRWDYNQIRKHSFSNGVISSKQAVIIKPILKKLHPDLFFHLSSSAPHHGNNRSIADINKRCIHNMQNIWNQILFYDQSFTISLLSPFSERGDDEQLSEEKVYESVQRKLESLHPKQSIQWQIPISRYLDNEYCLDCFYFSSSHTGGTSSEVKKVNFSLKIPSVFKQPAINMKSSQIPQSILATTYLQAMLSLLQQQRKFFELIQLSFPYDRNLSLIEDYLNQAVAADAFSASTSAGFSKSETLSMKHKAQLHNKLVIEHHYQRTSKEFTEYLQFQRKKLLSQMVMQDDEELEDSHNVHLPQSVILKENIEFIFQEDEKKAPRMVMNHINYFLHANHVRLQRLPENEEVPLLLLLQAFFLRYHDVLLFNYSRYQNIFLIVYWNEDIRRRGNVESFQCKRFESKDLPKEKGFASQSKSSKYSYILRIPHNFVHSDLIHLLNEKSRLQESMTFQEKAHTN